MSALTIRWFPSPSFDASQWYAAQHMPATVLQILQENGVYKNLYFGMNLATPGDLWKQDWWYRTTFTAPAGREVYSLIFKGINYRADIWLNGHKVANRATVVGMYDEFEFNVTEFIVPGGSNVLAVKVTPEQSLEGENGIELAIAGWTGSTGNIWATTIPQKHLDIPFVPDRNAGVWKRVFLSSTGAVTIRNPYVATDLPLPATNPASLTVYCDLSNNTAKPVSGTLVGRDFTSGQSRRIKFQQNVQLFRNQTKEIAFTPAELCAAYCGGSRSVVALPVGRGETLSSETGLQSRRQELRFPIRRRSISAFARSRRHAIRTTAFPDIGNGGNFYLQSQWQGLPDPRRRVLA